MKNAQGRTRREKQEQSEAKNIDMKNLPISHGRQVSALCDNFCNVLHYKYGMPVGGHPLGALKHMLPGSHEKPSLVASLALPSRRP